MKPGAHVLSAALLLCAAPAAAHDLCLVGGTVHPVAAPSLVGTVCITGERISGVFPASEEVQADRVVDVTGAVVTPGLVEASTALGLIEIWAVEDSNDTSDGGDDIRAAFRARDGVDPDSALLPVARSGGITSALASPSGGLVAGQPVWIDLAGETVDAMTVGGRPLLVGTLGADAGNAAGGSRGTAILRYREVLADARLYLADPGAYDRNQRRDLGASWLDLQALAPALRGQATLILHADAARDVLAGLDLADEFDLSVAFAGGADAWSIAEELAAAGTPVIVQPLRNLPESFDALGNREDNAALLDRAGVPVILSSGEAHNVRTLRQMAGNAVRAGMEWESALAAITLRPAVLAGVDDRYGTLEPGRVANIVVWSGDPFEPTTHVELVLIRGAEASLRSHQTELLERYRTLPLQR